MAIEQIRTALIIALCVVSFLLWDAWQRDYGPKPSPSPSPEQSTSDAGAHDSTSPSVDVPQVPQTAQTSETTIPSSKDDASKSDYGRKIRVVTDVLAVEIDTLGGTIAQVDLRSYPVSNDKPEEPFRLLDDSNPTRYFIAQSGLTGARSAPNHHARFEGDQDTYELADGMDVIDVPLRWRSDDGVVVTRTYRFARNRYVFDVRVDVANHGAEAWRGALYGQLQRGEPESSGGLFRTYTYTGGILSGPEKPYEKVDFSDMASQDIDRDVAGGWVAMIQHYFAAAWIPDAEETNHYYSKSLANGRFAIGVVSPIRTVPPGGAGDFSFSFYVGPKIQERMQDVAPHLERTVDYGWLWLIAEPLFWLLRWIHGFVGNWGWAIIMLTMLIKLAFFQLSATSYKSMARMRKLQPRITALRERYGADKQRMNQAMMELYRQEKINPLGGCLPILVQIPVFIALYWVLLESVELRQASFIGWLDDLSLHDPYFVLPVLMGVTMLIQQRLNPTPPDPMQAKIMMALPFVFTFFFLFFPSGLVLYWFVNNVLSIIQQWVITKKIVGDT